MEVSLTPRPLYHRRMSHQFPLNRRLARPQNRRGSFGVDISLLTCRESNHDFAVFQARSVVIMPYALSHSRKMLNFLFFLLYPTFLHLFHLLCVDKVCSEFVDVLNYLPVSFWIVIKFREYIFFNNSSRTVCRLIFQSTNSCLHLSFTLF